MRRDPKVSIPAEYWEMVSRADVFMASDWTDMRVRLSWLAEWAEGEEVQQFQLLAEDCRKRARRSELLARGAWTDGSGL